jgi:hypothetical protein
MNPKVKLTLALILLRAVSANVVELCDVMMTGSPQEAGLARHVLLSSLHTLKRRARRTLQAMS